MWKIVDNRDINEVAWASLTQSSFVASWFQTKEAFDFFDGLSFLEAFACGVENNGQLKGVVVGYIQKDGGKIKRFFSRRAIILGGPLLADDIEKDGLSLLLNTVKSRLGKKAIYIETRNFNDYSRWEKVFLVNGFDSYPHYDIHVNTTSKEQIDQSLGKSRKRDIRVSFRDGATVITQPSIEQIRSYYEVLDGLYKYKVKTPLFPLEFFEKLATIDNSAFLLVEYGGKIIGGTVCIGLAGVVLHELFACGEDGVYKNIFPSEVATFAGLQYAAENGYPKFDMMGAGSPDDGGYGVRDFKMKFGGELLELGRYKYICKPFLFQIGKLGVKIMKKL